MCVRVDDMRVCVWMTCVCVDALPTYPQCTWISIEFIFLFFISEPLLKLLVPNYAAGALIGKGGTNIGEMQEKFGGTIRLSPNREYYPGTDERIVVIIGEMNQLIDLNNHIMEKVQVDQSQHPENRPRDDARGQQVKIVLTNGAAGLLIGRGGLTIRAIQEGSKAKISISNREDAGVQGERVLTMSGTIEERVEGCRQVIEKISDEPSNITNTSLKYMNSGLGMNAISGTLGSMFNTRQQENLYSSLSKNAISALRGGNNATPTFGIGGLSTQSRSNLKTSVQIQVEVPDILVGAILGKQGQTIHEFIQFSGAKIQFSGKNEFAPGTTDRILTITGDMNQAQTAYFLINQKAEQAESELSHY